MSPKSTRDVDLVVGDHEDRGTRKLILLLMGLSVAVLILTPLITIYAFRTMSKDGSETEQKVHASSEVTLPKIQVNVFATQGTRYAQMDIVVEVSHPDLAKVLDEQSEDEPGNRLRRAMATIIEIAGDKPLEALCDSEGKRALANEIKGALNDLLAKEDKGMITDVYFAGFLVQ